MAALPVFDRPVLGALETYQSRLRRPNGRPSVRRRGSLSGPPAGWSPPWPPLDDELRRLDLEVSRFQPGSELARMATDGAGARVVSERLAEAISVALEAARWTGGRVDPTVGNTLVELGLRPRLFATDRCLECWRHHTRGGHRTRHGRNAAGRGGLAFGQSRRPAATGAGGDSDRPGGHGQGPGGRKSGGRHRVWFPWPRRSARQFGGGHLRRRRRPPGRVAHHAGRRPPQCRFGRPPRRPIDDGAVWRRRRSPCAAGTRPASPSTTSSTRLRACLAEGPWRTVSVAAASCVDANAASTAALVAGEEAEQWLISTGLPGRLVGHDGAVVLVGGWPAGEGREVKVPAFTVCRARQQFMFGRAGNYLMDLMGAPALCRLTRAFAEPTQTKAAS